MNEWVNISNNKVIVRVIHDCWESSKGYLCVANAAIDKVQRGMDQGDGGKENTIDLTLIFGREPEEDEGPLAAQENRECTGPGKGRSKKWMLVDEIREEVDLIWFLG